MSNICIGLKKTCLGVLERGNRDKDSETGLKEGGGIEMSTTVLLLRDAPSLLNYIPSSSSSSMSPLILKHCRFKFRPL